MVRSYVLSTYEKRPKRQARSGNFLKEFESIADDLPFDMAEDYNHYIHDHPKK